MSRFEYQPDPERDEDDNLNTQPHNEEIPLVPAEQRLGLAEDELGDAETTPENRERLRYVEDLLRNAPLISVSVGFAERVMAAIRGKDTNDPDYRDALGVITGLLISILFTLAVFGIPAYYLITSVISGDAAAAIDDLVQLTESFVAGFANLPLVLLPAAAAAVIGVIILSGYVVWFIRGLLTTKSPDA